MKFKIPTLDNVKEAVKIAHKGGRWYKFWWKKVFYKQKSWCGTSCCVWGHALLLAGNHQVVKLPGSASQSSVLVALHKFRGRGKRHMALGVMMESPKDGALEVVEELLGDRPVRDVLKDVTKSYEGDIRDKAYEALSRTQ